MIGRYAKLVQPNRPAFFIVSMEDDQFSNLHLELQRQYPENDILVIRGKKAHSLEGFFNEIGAILQVPYYFGENWNALNDVLYERAWLPGYVFLVTDAPLLLADAPAQFGFLLQLMDKCNAQHLVPTDELDENDDFGFHVLFQCKGATTGAFAERLASAGVEFSTL